MRLKKNSYYRLPILSILFLLLFQGCTEKKYIFIENKIELSGEVLAYYCYYETWGRDERYSVNTGKPAKVSFVSQSGDMCSINTDDSSGYNIFLDSGIYNIIVETGHSYPDTLFDVSVQKDTAINLSISYAWLVDDTAWINFKYENVLDTMGKASEVEVLKKLNYLEGGGFQEIFDIREVKTYSFIDGTFTYVIYSIPVNPDRYLWEVYERSYRLLQTTELGFPAGMGIGLSWYICHQ